MLDRNLAYKPLDFGNGLVSGSVNDRGEVIALNTAHPQHGYITLSALPPFPNDRWYDPVFVRDYRIQQALRSTSGFGIHFDGIQELIQSRCSIQTGAMPHVQLQSRSKLLVDVLAFAPYLENGQPAKGAIQLYTLTNACSEPFELKYEGGGLVALTRSSYAQLTEGGPIEYPYENYFTTEVDEIFIIQNRGLGAAIAVTIGEVGEDGKIQKISVGWQVEKSTDGRQLRVKLSGTATLEGSRKLRLAVLYGYGENQIQAQNQIQALVKFNLNSLQEQTTLYWEVLEKIIANSNINDNFPGATWLCRQALVYILACCTIPLEKGTTCLITDHQMLPLAWTRDSYYQVQALLALSKQAKKSTLVASRQLQTQVENIVRKHLIWLFELAEQPTDFWGRAYLTNGRCKDLIFQLDQQCYPLLELADYVETTGDTTLLLRFKPALENIFARLLSQKASEAWLFPTSETPADDKVDMPYHLSSQITVWRVMKQLAWLNVLESYKPEQLLKMAERIQNDIYHYMVSEHQGQKIFCYLTDLKGNYRFYHDANDWPTLLAVKWGFCSSNDPIWRTTLEFAFSPANHGGFYSGAYRGLGSIHTPHPWPLGDLQELFWTRLNHDATRQVEIWTKLLKVACWDGSFPEAYDQNSGEVASRHWFSWPGSMLVIVLMNEDL